LRAAVAPGSIVVDIGTGSGYFAVLACKLGARKVYAIEPDPIIELAEQVAVENGADGCIEFLQQLSTEVSIEPLADVLVSDLRGVLPFFESHIPTVIDARERLLRRGGIQIPSRDDIFACFVNSEETFARFGVIPSSDTEPHLGPFTRRLRNSWSKARIKPDECVSAPIHVFTLDYSVIEDASFSVDFEWTANADATLHGFCLWFNTVLSGTFGFSNAPTASEALYGQAFFPFGETVEATSGSTISVTLRGIFARGEYIWTWDTRLAPGGGAPATEIFRQSTLAARVMPRDKLLRRRNDHVPLPRTNHDMVQFVLGRVDGIRTLEMIAKELFKEYSTSFSDWQDALAFAGNVLERNR
jgi:protein arginine N-methyltransferase 1